MLLGLVSPCRAAITSHTAIKAKKRQRKTQLRKRLVIKERITVAIRKWDYHMKAYRYVVC
jgi:hypothetical protein